MKVPKFVYKGKERRLSKRRAVCWDALLEVRFLDFSDCIKVKVLGISAGGALLHSEKITVRDRHLLVADIKPELKLKISMPETVLELTTEIVWYNLLSDESIFEIGVSFLNFKKESKISVDELIKIMEAGK